MFGLVLQSESYSRYQSQVETISGNQAEIKASVLPWGGEVSEFEHVETVSSRRCNRQNPDNMDPDWWLEERELTKLQEAPRPDVVKKPAIVPREEALDIEMQVLPEDPAEVVRREGIYERIQRQDLTMDFKTKRTIINSEQLARNREIDGEAS